MKEVCFRATWEIKEGFQWFAFALDNKMNDEFEQEKERLIVEFERACLLVLWGAWHMWCNANYTPRLQYLFELVEPYLFFYEEQI